MIPTEFSPEGYALRQVTNAEFVSFLNRLLDQDEIHPSRSVITLSGSDEALINIFKSPIKFECGRFALVRNSLAYLPVTKVSANGARLYAESLAGGDFRVHGGLIHDDDDGLIGLDWMPSYRNDELFIVEKAVMRQVLGFHYELDDRLVLATKLSDGWQRNLLHQSEEALQNVTDEEGARDLLVRETGDWNECAFSFRLDRL
ncbi:MAG: hypothetical protein RL095_848 [Verrucomicrobiota bacterium]|jgi:hypothetical protein